MDVQHVNLKIFASFSQIDLGHAIPVFHRWIQKRLIPELPIDVADYRHVPNGPGVILVGHEAIYGLDLEGGRLGLLYNRRATLEGSNRDKFEQAYAAAAAACSMLEREPEFQGKLRFDPGEFDFWVNDRLIAPTTSETVRELEPEVQQFLADRFGQGKYEYEWVGEPRQLVRATVRARADRV